MIIIIQLLLRGGSTQPKPNPRITNLCERKALVGKLCSGHIEATESWTLHGGPMLGWVQGSGFRGLGFGALGFRDLGFRGLGV